MTHARFTYTGPAGGVELRLPDGTLLERQLQDGHPVELPADHEYTRTLKALGRLQALPEQAAPARKKRSAP